jgi:hypothetical protein
MAVGAGALVAAAALVAVGSGASVGVAAVPQASAVSRTKINGRYISPLGFLNHWWGIFDLLFHRMADFGPVSYI